MKPLFLELQAFGPFVGVQTVDFEKLSKSGIFLIKGETGSGKTTIFDAMSFALYGRATGESEKSGVGRNDIEQWRCNQANEKDPTVVACTFEAGGKKYRFTRKLVKKRTNFSKEFGCVEILVNGDEIAVFTNPKESALNEKAVELVGLNHEQFCQVVLLPQGKFERFLTAESGEKETILSNIFATCNWSKYARKLSDAASERYKQLKDEEQDITIRLSEEKLKTVDELAQLIDTQKQQLAELEESHKSFNGAEKQKQLDADRELEGLFAGLHKLELEKQKLAGEKQQIDAKAEQHRQAEKAEELRKPIEDNRKAQDDKNGRAAQLAILIGKQPEAEKKAEDAKQKFKAKEAESSVEELNKRIGELEGKKAVYSRIDALKAEWIKADSAYAAANKVSNDANDKLERRKRVAANALTAFNAAEDTAKQLRTAYFAGIYGEIASKLTEGGKCPVCGSTHHPEPAQKAEDSVSKEQMEEGAKRSEAAKKAWEIANGDAEKAQTDAKDCAAKLADAQTNLTKAKSDYDNAKNSLVEGIADSKALDAEIAKLHGEIEKFNTELDLLKTAREDAANALTKLQTEIKTAEGELEKAGEAAANAEQALKSALAGKGFADVAEVEPLLLDQSKRNALLSEVKDYKTRCEVNEKKLAENAAELEGKTEPDSAQFESRKAEILTESEKYNKASQSLKDSISRLNVKHRELAVEDKHFRENIVQAQDDMSFARALNGNTGISLERYVLGIMFDQVLGEANRMLQNMHGGRYYLERSDEAEGRGNKAGLDLLVHDNRSPESESRSVRMLSGGEKFLVSLALSIGLSHFAQKSGVRIEALFIDEGFGTLDDSSINDAMAILETVRGKSGMIGIISHVALLEGTISTHLEVVKKESGSLIKPV